MRAILGQKLPFGGYMGVNSFPGSDVTYTPPGDLSISPHPNVFSSQTTIEPVDYKQYLNSIDDIIHGIDKELPGGLFSSPLPHSADGLLSQEGDGWRQGDREGLSCRGKCRRAFRGRKRDLCKRGCKKNRGGWIRLF